MGIRATIITNAGTRVAINNQAKNQVVRSTNLPTGIQNVSGKFVNLVDVDASSLATGEVPVWDSANNNIVVKVLPRVDGGIY